MYDCIFFIFFQIFDWIFFCSSGFDGSPLHNCSTSPEAIREEVDILKSDINNRMKQVLFNSVFSAYYAGFIPCCFATVRCTFMLCVMCWFLLYNLNNNFFALLLFASWRLWCTMKPIGQPFIFFGCGLAALWCTLLIAFQFGMYLVFSE